MEKQFIRYKLACEQLIFFYIKLSESSAFKESSGVFAARQSVVSFVYI